MLRLSSYFILSEVLQSGGYAVLNGLSGAIDLINEDLRRLFYGIIQNGNPHELYIGENDLPFDILEIFVRRGHISTVSHEEERLHLKNVAAVLHELETRTKHIVIVPSLDCNYRCTYCFERDMQGRLQNGKTKMSISTVDAVYMAVSRLESETDAVSKEIILFGGEPLMAENTEVVAYIVNKGREKGFRFNAVTNGHDLNAFMILLGNGKIERLQITVDGPKIIHDTRRISLDGLSSYERIFSNIRQAINDTDVQLFIRVNLDQTNYRYFGSLLRDFEEESWLNNERVLINAAIVNQKDPDGSVLSLIDINIIREELLSLITRYENVSIGCPQSNHGGIVFSSLLSGKPYSLRTCYCGANCGMYIFLPNGNIASCWETLEEERSCIGSYSEHGLTLDKIKTQKLFGRSAAMISACADCRYCLVCAGGCSQYAELNSGDIYTPHCGNFPQTYSWVLAGAVENFLKKKGL